MATNRLPKSISELLDLGGQNIIGIGQAGAALGLLQYTVANFTPKVTALQLKQTAFNAARSTVADFSGIRMLRVADMRTACLLARKLLSISFGDDWSEEWTAAGWVNHTTEVPKSAGALEALCGAVNTFLLANPDYQIASPKVNFNASIYSTAKQAFADADLAFRTAKVTLGTARDARKADEKALRTIIHSLVGLLEGLMGPMDPRWGLFGLNRPGATVTPGKPENLTLAKVAGQATVLAHCGAVPLATYFRWFSKLIGVDTEFRFAGRTNDPMKEFPGQPSAGTLEVYCEAANDAGPGVKSEIARINLAQ